MTYQSRTFKQSDWIQQSIHTFAQWIQHLNHQELETLNLLCQHSHDILNSMHDMQTGQLVPVEMMLDELQNDI